MFHNVHNKSYIHMAFIYKQILGYMLGFLDINGKWSKDFVDHWSNWRE